jgi:hypothetical protein
MLLAMLYDIFQVLHPLMNGGLSLELILNIKYNLQILVDLQSHIALGGCKFKNQCCDL